MKGFKKLLIGLYLIIFGASCAFAGDVFREYLPMNNEKIIQKSTYRVSAINPTPMNNWLGASYPGIRGANQLVVYTQAHGVSTGTNEYGAEALTEGNIVTSISGADSLIPTNGIVISAHGNAKRWLNKNVHIGTKIYVDAQNKTITAITTSDSYIFAANEKIKETKVMMNYYERNTLNYNTRPTTKLLAEAKYNLRKAQRNPEKVQEYANIAMSKANEAMATAIPYKTNELKGIWIRPTNTTEVGIISTLDKLKSAGINNVFLETFFHGRTIFPSETMKKYGFIEQNPAFVGCDPLRIWITEAHKRGIKINIWFEAFYIGNKPQINNEILAVKPEWSNVNYINIESQLPVKSSSEHNGYFLDPANPEVSNFLVELVKEIITTYKPDGFNFDYCRYPQSLATRYSGYKESNWGYTKYARDEFTLIYGEDPVNIAYGTKIWNEWAKYRQDKVTLFIDAVSKLCRQNKTTITAVVFPNKTQALQTKQQDWVTWSDNNYIDAFTPLFLTCDAKTIKSMIIEMLENMDKKTKLYAGLFVTFMDGSSEDLIRQIHETRKLNLGGIILFDFAHLQERYIKTLTTSVFSNQSCTTYQMKSCKWR